MDSLGRTIKTVAKDSQGDVIVETHYDSLGRVDRVTNPYRAGDTVYWSKTRYDELGRAVETFAPAELENLSNAQSLGVTSFGISSVLNYVGTVVTTTDASGRKGRSISNAIGQLKRVDEPSGTLGLGAITAPYQPTSYAYDLLNNLTTVTQIGDTTAECGGASSCTQSRTFTYDALSRLKTAVNPESGTINYTYDANNNLATKTDARGITTNYTYDRLNRVTERSYAVPSPM